MYCVGSPVFLSDILSIHCTKNDLVFNHFSSFGALDWIADEVRIDPTENRAVRTLGIVGLGNVNVLLPCRFSSKDFGTVTYDNLFPGLLYITFDT